MIESNESINSIDTHKILATLPIMPYQNIACLGAEEDYFLFYLANLFLTGKLLLMNPIKNKLT